MPKLFKTLIILYSTVATVSATIQTGADYSFNPLTYGTENDPANNYDVIVPKNKGTDENPVYQKQLQQARIYTNGQLGDTVYTNSTGTAFSTTYGENGCTYKIFVQQCNNMSTYDTWNFLFNDNMPVVVKALKSNFVTPYKINGQDVFRQKMIQNEIELQFDSNGNPIFIKENNKEKQATYTNIPLYTDENKNICCVSNIKIQEDINNNTNYDLAYDNDNMPIVTKAKTKWGNDYEENGINVFRQKSLVEHNLVFDNGGNPIFNNNQVIIYYNEYSNPKFSTDPTGRSPVYIQSTNITNLTLAYDSDGNPKITKALKSDFLIPYQINGQNIFRQMFVGEPEFKYDNNNGTPIFSSEITNNSVFVKPNTSSFSTDFTSYIITDKVTPILIQQWYPTGDTSYNTTENMAFDDHNMPIIKPVYYYDNNDNEYKLYKQNGLQVYRQITTYENSFVFTPEDGNPIFMEDQYKLVPYFKQGDTYTEVDDTKFNIGQLVKVTNNTIQACVDKDDNNIKWYNLETYIANYVIENPYEGGNIHINQDINFIVKNDYKLKNNVDAKYKNNSSDPGDNNENVIKEALFIPKGVTLTMNERFTNGGGNDSDRIIFNSLVKGKIDYKADQNNSAIAGVCQLNIINNRSFIFAPGGEIYVPSSETRSVFNGGSHFFTPIIYPGFKLSDYLFTGEDENNSDTTYTPYYLNGILKSFDKQNVTDSDTSEKNGTLKSQNHSTILEQGVLYLNRFTELDNENAKLLKGIITYNMNVVYPNFLSYNDLKLTIIEGTKFCYIEFFPNLLWYGGDKPKLGHKVPATQTELSQDGGVNHTAFFEPVYSKKQRYTSNQYYTVDFVPDSMGRNVLSLIPPENPTIENTTPLTNPFAEEDAVFFEGTIKDNIIECEFKKPTYDSNNFDSSNSNGYNQTPTEDNNKYWNTATIDDLFVDGNNNPYKLSQNIPAVLNVGLIGDKNISRTDWGNITLNGDNQYYTGTYTVPANIQINLNHENALVSINQLDSNGTDVKKRIIVYKDVEEEIPGGSTPESNVTVGDNTFKIDNLSGLTYNIETNINWDISKTGNLLYITGEKISTESEENSNTNTNTNIQQITGKTFTKHQLNTDKQGIVLDMQLVGSDKVITFTNSNNGLVVDTITFNGNNTEYKINGSSPGYFIPSPEMNTVIFESQSSIVKIPSNLNLIFTSSDTIFIKQHIFMGALLKKVKYGTNKNIKTIILYEGNPAVKNTYTFEEYIDGSGNITYSWNLNGVPIDEPSAITNMFFYAKGNGNANNTEEEDNRDTVDDMRDPKYVYNNEDAIDWFYLNTEENGYYDGIIGNTDEDKTKYDINQLYNGAHETNNEENTENFSNNMPPILNIGLVNNGPLTIVNSDPNNTKVEINGINYGIRDCCSMNLLCWPDYDNSYYNGCTKEINSNTINDLTNNNIPYTSTIIGKPYTGILTVPNAITDIEFDFFSFIPNIQYSAEKKFNQNYTFKGYNIVQYYDTTKDIEVKSGSKILLPSYDEVSNQANVNYYDYPTQEEKLDLTLNKVTVKKGAKVILNKAHISVKAPQ